MQTNLNVNLLYPVYLSKAVLPRFQKRSERSGIINVSSVMSVWHCPGFSFYSAPKVFLSYFSKALSYEFKAEGGKIDVLDYKPAYVATKMSGMK